LRGTLAGFLSTGTRFPGIRFLRPPTEAVWQTDRVSSDAPTPLLYLVKRVELAVRKNLDVVLEAHGLTTIQYTALTTLARHDGMTAAALARYSFVAPQTVAQLVGVLEGRGWIERAPDPSSRRRQLLSLTDAGRRLLVDLREPIAAVEQRMVAGVDPADLATVHGALRAFGAALEPRPATSGERRP
jgi:Transcriptional regulators